jgi:DNA-binding NarL/FixJ family response regulator
MRPVLVVEDHPLVADATGRLLSCHGDDLVTVFCSTAAQTISALDRSPAEWFRIFLDLDVPGAYGLTLAREIRDRRLAARCCVVSAFDRPDYIDELRKWGFLGYIVKAVSVTEFTTAVGRILEGAPYFPNAAARQRGTAPARLTRRQSEILERIQSGLSSKQIAAELYLAEGTVNNQVAAILQALDAGSRTQAVAKAIELGLLSVHPEGAIDEATSVRSRR